MKKSIFIMCFLILSLTLQAQTQPLTKEEKKKEREAIEKMLKAYTACRFPDKPGFVIHEVDRMAKNKEQLLARETASGYKGVSRTDSYRVMIIFTDTPRDILGRPYYFANVRPDRSKPSEYENDKKVIGEYLEQLIVLGADTVSIKKPLEESFNGFNVYSVYRSVLAGSNQGTSIVFDDANKVVTTVYFLNEPKDWLAKSHFNTVEEWMALRKAFLESYTKCVAENLNR